MTAEARNHLAGETSPYLLQHAGNPVDWWPWSDEAIAEARRRDLPIFLSIGYSTCYWCHVMERESFENERTAAVLNEHFVPVKVDREQRPDLDDIYMAATIMLTGRGGWPMSVFLEPARLRPFWAGTYFPDEPRHGMPSFRQLLEGMAGAWRDQRGEVDAQAEQLAGAVAEQLAGERRPVAVGAPQVTEAVEALLRQFDRTHGGFGGAPKFPQPVFLGLLLAARAHAGDEATTTAIDAAARTTLDRMALGGLFDQIGGGFHRYAVDAVWLVPHFEKMLYDNAQLACVYARAARIYDDAFYRRITRRTLDYLLREMTDANDPGGAGFFSAQDAEVDGREGQNYLWSPEELRDALGADDADLAIRVYGLDKGANFRDPHHPEDDAKNILRLDARPAGLAGALGLDEAGLLARLDAINAELYRVRARRPQPHLDDKVIAAWNGLAIAGLVAGADALGEPRYFDAAERAARFVLGAMRHADGSLRRVWRAGVCTTPGFLDDHAFMIKGLLALHRSEHARTRDHLDAAVGLLEHATRAFGDGAGGFFDTREGQQDLFVRARTSHDGALPSGAGVMLDNLITLAEVTGEDRWLGPAVASLASLSGAIQANPLGSSNATGQLPRLMAMGDRLGERATFADASERSAPTRAPRVVDVLADTDGVVVTDAEPAAFHLRLRIRPPHHVVAADPGPDGEGLVPLRVGLLSGQGVGVYADYPEGEAHGVAEVGSVRVHHGEIDFQVVLERAEGTGVGPGTPVLGVTFQACTDTECLAPQTVRLAVDVTLDAGAPD